MTTTNEPAGIDLDNAALDNLEALARAVDDLPETTQPFVSMGGQVVIHTFSMSPEQVRAVANLYDAATPSTIVALIAQARRAAQAASANDEQALIAARDRRYPMPDSPHASVVNQANLNRTAYEYGWSDCAALAKPEGATGTTGAPDDLDYLLDYIPSAAARAEAKAKVADLRAQLAASTENLRTAVRQAWEANAELSKLRAAPASAQPDRGAEQGDEQVSVLVRDLVKLWDAQSLSADNYNEEMCRIEDAMRAGGAAPSPASQPVAPETAHADYRTYDEACNLAKAIHAQHYRDDSPNWRVLPDLRGVISQISNMVAGMTRTHHVYRLTAPTTVPDHSEREAANAGGLPVDLIHDFRDAINIAHHRADHAGDTTRMKRWKEVSRRLEAYVRTINAPATIAAGQEAANAKDAARVTYTCKGKGGAYSLIGVAYGAGTSRDTTVNLYREVGTGVMYFRTPADFHDRMERINAAMAAVGAAGQEGGGK